MIKNGFLDVHISDLRYAPIGQKSFLVMVHDRCTHLRLQVEMVGNSSSSNLFLIDLTSKISKKFAMCIIMSCILQ